MSQVDSHILKNTNFKYDFSSIIWNSKIGEEEFEEGWDAVINEYNLTDNKWLSDMYDLRESWIPAFFKYVPLSGLMRTTSRSESQNSAFHQNTHYGSTLVHFMISFEAAMEKQRFTQLSCDFKTTDKTPRMVTPFEIEKNASLFYTRRVFRQVQYEMYISMVACTQFSVSTCDNVEECLVKEFRHVGDSTSKDYSVKLDDDDEEKWDVLMKESVYKVFHHIILIRI